MTRTVMRRLGWLCVFTCGASMLRGLALQRDSLLASPRSVWWLLRPSGVGIRHSFAPRARTVTCPPQWRHHVNPRCPIDFGLPTASWCLHWHRWYTIYGRYGRLRPLVTVCLFMYTACAETGALTPDVDVWSQWRHHLEDGMCMQQWDVLLGCMSGLRVSRRSDLDHAIIGIMQRALEHAYVRTGHFNFTDCSPQPW